MCTAPPPRDTPAIRSGLPCHPLRPGLHDLPGERRTLRNHCQCGRELRVLTTTYTGSTKGQARDAFRDLGAEVRVSYDTSTTRLHAKAWLVSRRLGPEDTWILRPSSSFLLQFRSSGSTPTMPSQEFR